jgi:prepilin-type N-terminal cleavage/methylation domain-containing protein
MARMTSSFKSNRPGITMIELLVGLVISAIIGSIILAAIFQIVSVSESNKNRMAAIIQIENSLNYLNRDAQVANTITPDPSSGLGFPVTLLWKTWDNKTCQVVYSLENGNLVRSYFENDLDNPTRVDLIAHSINSADLNQTNCSYINNLFTIKITATVGSFRPANVSRTLTVTPRSVHFYN